MLLGKPQSIKQQEYFITGYDFQLFNPKWQKLQRYKEKIKAMTEKLHTMETIQPGCVAWRVTHVTFRQITRSTNFCIYCHWLTYDDIFS
jgi:succinylglutamate desuccinylase